ncbi:hypothetical protein GCM10027047_15330 [Rhodococcus aerolatus]
MSPATAPATTPTARVPRFPVLAAQLRADRRSLLLWAVAVGAVAAVYTSAWSAVGSAKSSVVDSLPPALVEALNLGSIGTPGGFLASTVYGLLGPALLLVHAVGRGARLLAGEEEDGTLELVLTAPVSRGQVYRERLAAVWLGSLVLVAVLTAVVLLLSSATGMGVPVGDVLAGSAGLALLVLGVGAVAFAVGAATGRRAVALAGGAAVAVLAYLANALGAVLGWGWLSAVSPWSWYLGGEPLTRGVDVVGLLRLAVLALVVAAAGRFAVDRRDLRT